MKKMRLVVAVSLLLFLMVVSSTAWAINAKLGPVDLDITGFYQLEVDAAIGNRNPNNQPNLVDSDRHPRFMLGRQYIDLNIRAKFTEEFSITLEPRFFQDFTRYMDSTRIIMTPFPSALGDLGICLTQTATLLKLSYGRRLWITKRETCGFVRASNRLPGEKRLPYVFWMLSTHLI